VFRYLSEYIAADLDWFFEHCVLILEVVQLRPLILQVSLLVGVENAQLALAAK